MEKMQGPNGAESSFPALIPLYSKVSPEQKVNNFVAPGSVPLDFHGEGMEIGC
jgi:hypothetical protein